MPKLELFNGGKRFDKNSDKYAIRTKNNELYLQNIALKAFGDDKRNFLRNIKNEQWF